MASIFDLINQKKAELDNKKETIKPKQGTNMYIFLPSWRPTKRDANGNICAEPFWAEYAKHWIKNEAGEVQAVCSCGKATGKHCPVCDALAQAKSMYSADPVMDKIISGAESSVRYLFNVLEVTNGSINPDKVEVLDLTRTTAQAVFGIISSLQQQGIQDPMDLHNIYPVTITRNGQGMQNTQYSVSLSIRPIQFDAKTIDVIMNNVKNLDDFVSDDPANEVKALTSIKAVTGGNILLPPTTPSVAMISNNSANVVTPVINTLSEPVIDDFIPTFDTPASQPQSVMQAPTIQQTSAPQSATQIGVQETSGTLTVDANQLNSMLQGL